MHGARCSRASSFEPRYAEGPNSMARTAADACTAIRVLTGTELRFDVRGEPRRVADAAKSYRERLDRR